MIGMKDDQEEGSFIDCCCVPFYLREVDTAVSADKLSS